MDIGKFPAIPPYKGGWYNVVDKKYLQALQVVPHAFPKIAVDLQPQYNKMNW